MEEIASVYARSLFEVAVDDDKLDVVREQLQQFAEALNETQTMQVFLFSPYFSSEEKKEGLRAGVSDAEPIFMNFLELLIEKHRMPAIFRIERAFEELWDEHHKRLPVNVTSAVELDEATVARIGERIAEQTGREVELTAYVEPDILGGIVVRVGNAVLDASIRHRLENLRRSVARAT